MARVCMLYVMLNADILYNIYCACVYFVIVHVTDHGALIQESIEETTVGMHVIKDRDSDSGLDVLCILKASDMHFSSTHMDLDGLSHYITASWNIDF